MSISAPRIVARATALAALFVGAAHAAAAPQRLVVGLRPGCTPTASRPSPTHASSHG